MAEERPYRWEKSYPPGVRWDAPIARESLGALLDRARAFGTRTAIEYRGHDLSYEDLGRMADRVAAALMARGVGRGTRVALYLPNTPYHPLAFFAAARLGAPVVHLSPLDAERELAFKLKDSEARILITTNVGAMPRMAAKLLAAGLLDWIVVADEGHFPPASAAPFPCDGKHIVAFGDLLDGDAPLPEFPRVDADDLALLQYTGGTTGTPKAAMLTHGNLTAAVSIYDAWSLGQGLIFPGEERVICVLPLFHIYALTTVLLRHLNAGNRILLRERFDVAGVLRDIEEKRATMFPGVPTMWIAIASFPGIEGHDFSALRFAGSGAAPLPVEIAARVERITGKRLGSGWGMTETSPAGTSPPRDCDRAGTIGLPLPGIALDVVALDDPRQVLDVGEVGELRVHGPNVTAGYWNRPEETAASFVDGYLLTGDIGRMDEDGFFYLVDRKKDLIISGGFNVYPSMIEHAIYEHPAVEEVVVVGMPDRYRGEAAKAFVKLKSGAAPFTLDALRAFLGTRLGKHEIPAALEFRASLPKSAVGKLMRKELAAEERARAAAATKGEVDA